MSFRTILRRLPPPQITAARSSPASQPIICLPVSSTPRRAKRSGYESSKTSDASSHPTETMLIIPAIDLKDGRCVRLFQGEMDRETVYFEEPVAAARHWLAEGASFLHVVDLNGAVAGRPVHEKEVQAICGVAGLSVELGGGLRTLEAVAAAFDLG